MSCCIFSTLILKLKYILVQQMFTLRLQTGSSALIGHKREQPEIFHWCFWSAKQKKNPKHKSTKQKTQKCMEILSAAIYTTSWLYFPFNGKVQPHLNSSNPIVLLFTLGYVKSTQWSDTWQYIHWEPAQRWRSTHSVEKQAHLVIRVLYCQHPLRIRKEKARSHPLLTDFNMLGLVLNFIYILLCFPSVLSV